jgi:hypothetical protein
MKGRIEKGSKGERRENSTQ